MNTADQYAITERAGRAVIAGTWGCAGLVMLGSVTNAVLAYGAIGDNRGLGLATGLAVDTALCVALIGDRRLYAHGQSSSWGRALRITTAAMSLVLNTGIAVRDGHLFMAVLHAFLPILLVVLTEYGQDVLLKFTALRMAATTATPSPRTMPPPAAISPLSPPAAAGRADPPAAGVAASTAPPVASSAATSPRAPAPAAPSPAPSRPAASAAVSPTRQVIVSPHGAVPTSPTAVAQPRRERKVMPTQASRARTQARKRVKDPINRRRLIFARLDADPTISSNRIAMDMGISARQVGRYREEWSAERSAGKRVPA